MNQVIFFVCCCGFLTSILAWDIYTSQNVVEQDANGMKPLTPQDLADMELIEQPTELGEA